MTSPTQHTDRERFWGALDSLVESKTIVIDRPAGQAYPRYPNLVYPFDYGYLHGTHAMDGGGIDVWVGGQGTDSVTGVVATVDLYKNDAEIKILIGCTHEEMVTIEAYHNGQSQSGFLCARGDGARRSSGLH